MAQTQWKNTDTLLKAKMHKNGYEAMAKKIIGYWIQELYIFKHPQELPQERKATYLRVVAAFRPTKEDPYRIRWTVRGNRIVYPGKTYTTKADIITVKLLFNSVVSTPKAKFLGIDLKDFYLQTPMARFEYIMVQRKLLPQEVIDALGLEFLIYNDSILV